jgi:TonB family protein
MVDYAPIYPERPLRRAAVAVAVSLGVHVGLLLLLASIGMAAIAAARRREAEQPKAVALARIDAARWEENRTVAKGYIPSAAFDNVPTDLAKPERARFLSDRDRHVERETVAAPAPGMPGKGARAVPQPKQLAGQTSGESPGKGGAERSVPAPAPTPDSEGARPMEKGPDLHTRPLANRPLVMNFDVGGEGGVPEIDGVAVGGLTVLNAEAWRYATFFDRIGDTLYGVWRVEFLPRPPPASVVVRPRGGIARVALSVTLDANGKATVVSIRRSSGFADVDALLAELVRNSAPFPNVPAGLLDDRRQYSDIWIIALVWGRQGP